LLLSHEKNKQFIYIAVGFSAGALYGDTFTHLIPESFERLGNKKATSLYVLSGVLAFLFLKNFFGGGISFPLSVFNRRFFVILLAFVAQKGIIQRLFDRPVQAFKSLLVSIKSLQTNAAIYFKLVLPGLIIRDAGFVFVKVGINLFSQFSLHNSSDKNFHEKITTASAPHSGCPQRQSVSPSAFSQALQQ
jgi:hypothetical protein